MEPNQVHPESARSGIIYPQLTTSSRFSTAYGKGKALFLVPQRIICRYGILLFMRGSDIKELDRVLHSWLSERPDRVITASSIILFFAKGLATSGLLCFSGLQDITIPELTPQQSEFECGLILIDLDSPTFYGLPVCVSGLGGTHVVYTTNRPE